MDASSPQPTPRPKRPWLRKTLLILAIAVGAFVAVTYVQAWPSLGASPEGARKARMEASPEWQGDRFVNAQAMWTDFGQSMVRLLSPSPHTEPEGPLPVVTDTALRLRSPPGTGLRVTWFGHSSSLVEIDGVNVLLDPIWSERPSPVPWAGPARWFSAPLGLTELPRVDAVLISHDHYDHLDRNTVRALIPTKARFVVPLGVGAHLEKFGVPEAQISELDWWQETSVGPLRVTATPSRHASGRINPQRDETLWAGYAMVSPAHRVWYSGDTGFHNALTDIGERLGPFDVTLIESGQYDAMWPDWHIGPELAVLAHQKVRGKVMIPVHWALFKLANHSWTEPGERVLAAARCYGVNALFPRPGEPVEPSIDQRPSAWWPQIAWKTAEETPVVATLQGDANERVVVPPCMTE
jgi:L-ascorbate metabolism protein UlaG (beta-lactamase superfamily)